MNTRSVEKVKSIHLNKSIPTVDTEGQARGPLLEKRAFAHARTHIHTDKHTHRHTNTQAHTTHTHITHRQTHRQTHTQTHTTHTHTDR